MSSRDALRTALLCLLSIRCLPAQAPAAHIRIDTNRVIGEVNPHIFGNFAEHLGRCIYGRIFEEGSPLSDSDGFRKDVMEAVKPLGVSLLRWPGGNFASGYNWVDGVGPRDQRPARPDHAWGALESNRFGTDEFLRYCERVGAEPYSCINAGLGLKMANLAQLVNVIAPIFTNKQGLYLQTIYFPLAEYGKQRGNSSLDVQVTSPTYKIGNRQPLGYLDVSSTYKPGDRSVYLNVLNRSEKSDISAHIENAAGSLAGQAAIWEMNHADLKAMNDFGSEKVRPVSRTVNLTLAANGFTYSFPKHSLTILRLKID